MLLKFYTCKFLLTVIYIRKRIFLAHLWGILFWFPFLLWEPSLCCFFMNPPGGFGSIHWWLRSHCWLPHLHLLLTFFLKTVFKVTWCSKQIRGRYRDLLWTPKPTHISPPHYQHCLPDWYICYSWWTSMHIVTTPNLDWTTVTVGVTAVYGFGQMYDVSIIRVFHYSEKSSIFHLFIYSLPPTPDNHWYFSLSP